MESFSDYLKDYIKFMLGCILIGITVFLLFLIIIITSYLYGLFIGIVVCIVVFPFLSYGIMYLLHKIHNLNAKD